MQAYDKKFNFAIHTDMNPKMKLKFVFDKSHVENGAHLNFALPYPCITHTHKHTHTCTPMPDE